MTTVPAAGGRTKGLHPWQTRRAPSRQTRLTDDSSAGSGGSPSRWGSAWRSPTTRASQREDGQASAKEKAPSTSESTNSESSTEDTNPVKTAVKQLQSRVAAAREKASRRGRMSAIACGRAPCVTTLRHLTARTACSRVERWRRGNFDCSGPAEQAPSRRHPHHPRLVGGGGLRAPRARTRRYPRQDA